MPPPLVVDGMKTFFGGMDVGVRAEIRATLGVGIDAAVAGIDELLVAVDGLLGRVVGVFVGSPNKSAPRLGGLGGRGDAWFEFVV